MSVSAWCIGGFVVMYAMGLAIATEMEDFPGGGRGLAASILPGAQAMRLMRWPAERIDTVGGYLTYHNVLLFAFLVAIYAAVQGARAVRGDEDRHVLEEILATGRPRRSVIRDRTLGFVLILSAICLALALGTAAALAGDDQPDLAGSLITMVALGLCAMVAYSLGLLVSQLTPTARSAAGLSSLILTILYLCTNVWDELGPLGAIRFVSPFYYFSFSRALVPGHGFDLAANATLILMSVIVLALASLAFERRDYGSSLWVRRQARQTSEREVTITGQRVLGSVWSATILRGRFGLLAWSASAAGVAGLLMFLEPTVMDMWSVFAKYMPGTAGYEGEFGEALYVSFSGEIVAPVIAAYVITQTAGWVGDLREGRVETVLAGPVSWTRLVLERLMACVLGIACIALGAVIGLVIGALAIDASLDAAGLGRLAAAVVLLGAALGAIAAVAVAIFRRGGAVVALGVFVGASYLVGYLSPIFEWPKWVARLNIFGAYGHPYVEWPAASDTVLLLAVAIVGCVIATAIAVRTPKVA